MRPVYPFSAIVGQDALKLALLLVAIDPGIGGVLVMGDRGTGKSTAIRALARLLPEVAVTEGCRYRCAPESRCGECVAADRAARGRAAVPMVDLPLGVSEDRVTGALDLERALGAGEKAFQPGLLAEANRGFLYIDEVNLLEDHLVDLLLDVAASGENVVERDGLSVRHPARFLLVGSGNPEEGELRPQFLDRFGLAVDVATPGDVATRVEIVKRRDAFDRGPERFAASWAGQESALAERIVAARDRLDAVAVPDVVLEAAARLCIALGTDGLRGELVSVRAARALAAFRDTGEATTVHLAEVASMALAHRLRRDPLESGDGQARVAHALAEAGLG